jgi:1,4-dihydroxy-2-naphthoate octaprenyltransferase
MDRDEESIGGLKKPLQPTKQLFTVTVIMDVVAAGLSFLVTGWFAAAFIFYIICSRLYSYRGIRLKSYPIIGYLTVIVNQGALTFFMVYHGASVGHPLNVPWHGLLISSFLIGGFYPITQVYQHEADAKDGIITISMLLGKRGTFIFCAVLYMVAFALLFHYYNYNQQLTSFLVIQIFFIPVLVFFASWFFKVLKNERQADFKHMMQMNWIASTCTSLAFITIIFLHEFG